MSAIFDLMQAIRDFVNDSRKHYELRQNKDLFSRLVSALDTIEDTELAIKAFKRLRTTQSDSLYLAIYGLLQAMFLQQDAVTHLCQALNIDDSAVKYPELVGIRDIRKDAIGHPTKRDVDKKQKLYSYHQISRVSMTKYGFEMLTYYGDGSNKFSEVILKPLMDTQRKLIQSILQKVLLQLDSEEKTHKAKFRMTKLERIFTERKLSYAFEKLINALNNGQPTWKWAIPEITDAVSVFTESLKERNYDNYEHIKEEYIPYFQFAIDNLTKILEKSFDDRDNQNDHCNAYIYIRFLQTQINSFIEYAQEIDRDYSE